jgi:aryl-alcohol dehydrogenase-like predicted oxidoreductase
MEKRTIGNSGLKVAPLCLGGNVLGWTADEPTSFKIMDAFMEAGFNFIDTADVYSKWAPGHQGGESETVLGHWMKQRGNRKEVVVATKVGSEMAPDKKGLSKAYILQAVEDSLKRLQTDYIDLYQSHIDDTTVQLEETLETYSLLVKQGKVRAVGASNYTAERLGEALAVSRQKGYPAYQCLQPQYNLCERPGYETTLEPFCQKENLGVITYYSLAAGFLTGKYRSEADLSKSPRGRVVKKYLNDRGFRILEALDQVSRNLHSTPGRVALAWVAARPSVTAPIASATSLEQLNDLTEGMKLKLDFTAMDLLNRASA